ncbi:MAG: glutamate racemase [Pseudorhodoplanes sp.]|uniref:glutamate racemase n=1 Tax=Pseudorhodoplanes sp. TaxID=1934341 RepID=UPI003D12E7E7
MSTAAPRILVLDSGLGGLTVYREVTKLRPDAHYVYVADDVAFPYGRLPEDDLSSRVVGLMGQLIDVHRPDLVVIACNTASTIVLAQLRERFAVRFVGTVPAIKPACAASQTRLVSVLGTEATVTREYTRKLIADFGQGCDVTLVGSRRLAVLAEAVLRGEAVEDADIADEIAPCFVARGGLRTDTVVMACTHYPLLDRQFSRLAPWPVTFVDPAPAIARRVVDLIGARPAQAGEGSADFLLTSGKPANATLAAGLARFGLRQTSPV